MIRPARTEDVALLPAIEARAAARFADVGLPAAADLPVHAVGALHAACREERLLVAVDAADVAIGFAVLEAHADGDAHLLELDVEPAHAGKGLGRALVAATVAWARDRGLARVTLTTFRDIPFNAPFYARIGFAVLGGADVGPRLAAVLAAEIAHGVDLAPRVAMAMATGPIVRIAPPRA